MTLDAFAFEPHFWDHLAPVWAALPAELRGTLTVDADLVPKARVVPGVQLIKGSDIRTKSGPPKANPGPGPVALLASYGDMKVARRLGYRRFVFLEHGIGQSYGGLRSSARHGSYPGGADREDVELFLVPNEHAGARWQAAYRRATVAVVGCPKLDVLPARDPGGDTVVALGWHWNSSLGDGFNRPAFHFYKDALPALAERHRVIGHAHPRGLWDFARHYRRLGIPIVEDFVDVCKRADIYLADNTSTLYEFASTGRPVVVLNQPAYRKDVSHGLRFWAAADVGIQVDRPEDLVDSVAEALRDAPERQASREAALDIVYARRRGATDAAVEAITAWVAAKVPVAA